MKTKKKCGSVAEWGPQLFYDCPNYAAPGMHYCVECLEQDASLESPLTNGAKQAMRRYRLDITAQLAGFPTWAKLETAALRDEIQISKMADDKISRLKELELGILKMMSAFQTNPVTGDISAYSVLKRLVK